MNSSPSRPLLARRIFTIGHSSHELGAFLALLRKHDVEALVDVRSYPASRFAPQFNRNPFASGLRNAGVMYEFVPSLGGRPTRRDMYDGDGHVLYGRVAETPEFVQAIAELADLASRKRVAIMCGEEDPSECHRRLLVGKVLIDAGLKIDHIRGTGELVPDHDLRAVHGIQAGLFEGGELTTWRSIRSVLPSGRPRTSSEP